MAPIARQAPQHHDPLFGRTLRRLLSLWSERRALADLSDDALADIGLSRGDADVEARRAPWDVPEGRRFDDDRSMGGDLIQTGPTARVEG